MIRGRAFGAAISLVMIGGLVGCVAPAPDVPPLRDPAAAISSQVNVTPERLAGAWVVRRSWIGDPYLSTDAAGGMAGLRIVRTPQGVRLKAQKFGIDAAKRASFLPFAADLRTSGPGRFEETGGQAFGGAALWVLWMDADDRTVAIGTPNGRFGWIMDRKATGGQDRIKAASDIMEWMGYDLSKAQRAEQ
ncbi:lipocalin family protein [Rhodobacteraceae bacterium D3-12]|nr:lipocalin family protein [Rhodobacteraceae bacterium D3-12]